ASRSRGADSGDAAMTPTRAILSGASQAIAAPLRAAALLTAAKSFEANPLIGSRRLNEWGLHTARVALAHRMAARRRTRLADLVSAEDRAAFDRDGFVVRENFLPQAEFETLLAETRAHRGASREITQGDTRNRKIAIDGTAVKAIPALLQVL